MLYPGKAITLKSAPAEIEAARFVKVNGALCGAGEQAIGVTINKTALGDSIGVFIDGIVHVAAGGDITAGQEVVSNAAGKAVAATAIGLTAGAQSVTADAAAPTFVGSALPQKILGVAVEAGADGATIAVKLK